MDQEILNTYKNLFLVFPPGCGGNHLANMISLTPGFTPRKVCNNYMLEMYEEYANKDKLLAVHFSDLQNLQPTTIKKYGERYVKSDLRNIWVSHYSEYLFMNYDKTLPIRTLPEKIFCLFSSPSEGSLAFKRMILGPWAKIKEIEPPECYTPEVFCNNTHRFSEKIDIKRVFTIDTERFFLSYDYLSTTLYDNLEIELPEICRLLHHTWLEHVKEYVAEIEVDKNIDYKYTIRTI